MNKLLLFISFLLLITFVTGTAYFLTKGGFGEQWPSQEKPAKRVEPSPGSELTISGEIDCLPHKGSGERTLECAYGLRSDDGNHYGLEGLSQEDLMTGKVSVGRVVEVRGWFRPALPSEKYDIAGTIEIDSLVVEDAVQE